MLKDREVIILDDLGSVSFNHAMPFEDIKAFHDPESGFLSQMQAFVVQIVGTEFILDGRILMADGMGNVKNILIEAGADAHALITGMDAQALEPEDIIGESGQFDTTDDLAFDLGDDEPAIIQPAVKDAFQIIMPTPDTAGHFHQPGMVGYLDGTDDQIMPEVGWEVF